MAFGLVCALALPSLPPKAPTQELDTPIADGAQALTPLSGRRHSIR